MTLCVLVNPRSRSARRDPALVQKLQAVVGDLGDVVAPLGQEALCDVLRDLHSRGVRRLALHGGDGTGHRVATALAEVWPDDALPELMWLTGGTMNTVSRSMGQRGRPARQLASWVHELRGGPRLERTQRWPLCVDGTQHGFLFGIGIVPRFIEIYEGGGEPNPWKAAAWVTWASVTAFTGGAFAERFFRKIPADVITDGSPWPGQAWSILTAGAVRKIGLEFEPFPGVLDHPGHMHVFGTGSSATGFIRDMVPLRFGKPARHPLAHDRVCRRLEIAAQETLTYNLDGDLYTAGERIVVETTRPLTFVLGQGAKIPKNI